MITSEEREELINAATERALLMLPEVIGNLVINHLGMVKINKEFYAKYQELSTEKDTVAAVVELIEGQNPGMDYKEILERAVPLIRERIKTIKGLNTTTVNRPSRKLTSVEFKGNGEL